METEPSREISQDDKERLELALSLSKEVVQESSIEDISNYVSKEYNGLNFTIYKFVDDRKVTIYTEVGTEFGIVKLEFPLVLVANYILLLIKKLLSNADISEVLRPSVMIELRKRNIDVLTLFDLKESEVDEDIREKTKRILKLFIYNIPFLTRASVMDALSNSILGYFQHAVKPSLKEHWESLNLPKKFNLITDSEIDKVREYNLDRKKYFLGDKKQLLTEERFLGLADEADELKKKYSEALPKYFKLKNEFYQSNQNISNEKLEKEWSDLKYEHFPDLNVKALGLFEERQPFELARIHLADFYGYSELTMLDLIKKSRRLKRKGK